MYVGKLPHAAVEHPAAPWTPAKQKQGVEVAHVIPNGCQNQMDLWGSAGKTSHDASVSHESRPRLKSGLELLVVIRTLPYLQQ